MLIKKMFAILLCFVGSTTIAFAHTDENNKTVEYLQSLQNSDGGYLFKSPSDAVSRASSLSATSVAVRALNYFGGNVKNQTVCRRFVTSCFDKNFGGFADHPGGEVTVMATSVGVMAAADLAISIDDQEDAAFHYLVANAKTFEDIRIAAAGLESMHKLPPQDFPWQQEILKSRNPDGTYGKAGGVARDSGSAAVIILRLGGKIDNKKQLLNAIKSGQRADGGFGKAAAAGSDLETSYRVMRAFIMLDDAPDTSAMRSFIGKCKNSDGGYAFEPGQASNAAATYFAGIMLHWLKNASGRASNLSIKKESSCSS